MHIHSPPLLLWPPGTRMVRLLCREKRFRVLVEHDSQPFWVHTNNSGSMLGLIREGRACVISPAANPARKLAWTLEAIDIGDDGRPVWVGVNTMTPNRLLYAAFAAGGLQEVISLPGYAAMRREVTSGEGASKSRVDALLIGERVAGLPPLWVEAKNVTMVEDGVAAFPDAVTERGRKHLECLMQRVRSGERAAVFCCIQRPDGDCFGPADYIDPAFAATFWQAVETGVAMWPLRAVVWPPDAWETGHPGGIAIGSRLPLASRPASA